MKSGLVRTPVVTSNGVHTHVWKSADKTSGKERVEQLPAQPPAAEYPLIIRGEDRVPEESFYGRFGKDVVENYTEGDCWVLAAFMRDEYGLPAFAIMQAFDDEEDSWVHICNQLPDGRFVDITGAFYGETLAAEWRATKIVPADPFLEPDYIRSNWLEPNDFFVVNEVGYDLAVVLGLEGTN